MKNFKEEELIMYVYQDCTPELSKAIDKAILEDAELKKQVETSNGQGLNNLKSLYSFLSDKEVLIEQNEVFTVKVPLIWHIFYEDIINRRRVISS